MGRLISNICFVERVPVIEYAALLQRVSAVYQIAEEVMKPKGGRGCVRSIGLEMQKRQDVQCYFTSCNRGSRLAVLVQK